MITPTDVIFTDLLTRVKVNHHFPVSESMVINAKDFINTMECVSAPLTITSNGGKIFFTGKTRQTRLSCESVSDYPAEPVITTESVLIATIDADDIEVMKNLLKYTASDELRPIMARVCIDNDRVVASDAHKLAYIKVPDKKANVLFSSEVIQLIALSESKSFSIFDDGKYNMAVSPTMTVLWKKVEGSYPNWRSVVANHERHITIPLQETIKALKSILPTINGASYLVKFEIKKEILTVSTQDLDYDSFSSEKVNIFNEQRVEQEFGLKYDFIMTILQDLLKQGFLQVDMSLGKPNQCVVFEDRYLLMPMMINA